MKRNNNSSGGHHSIFSRIMSLPSQITKHHHLNDLGQMVLHYLAHKDCFNLKRAAYFVDNPDFNHLLGAAGYCPSECSFDSAEKIWEEPSSYREHLKEGQFHQKIRSFLQNSLKAQQIDFHNSDHIFKLGKDLGMEQPSFIEWDLKHGNHGILIYDSANIDDDSKEFLAKAASLLSFCPV